MNGSTIFLAGVAMFAVVLLTALSPHPRAADAPANPTAIPEAGKLSR